ncbi:eukaryotic translation initiation factor 4 gamma 3-like isoform X3 [Scleropages formosus]|uniref:eukaryotic translation initiation factor 4 gamma 3-like isoform X3 n=1 Tax=Scleropages formosus TaxID=113540 RepID=UPI0010FAA72C|nr:eukaryotic translation initiation factor 4 gamma 3-like isoform X3 [Scleropages formosus]
MSLPPKAVPKPTAAAVSGPGPGPGAGPSPSSQLRAALTSVSLPPGAPGAAQPPSVPPQQIARIQPALEERIFPAQPAVAAVYSVPRHTGPPYAAHDLTKGHPNLAGTPPGHASSPGLTQSPYSTGQNAGTAPLVYSPQTQPMNAQAQSRPFATGPRPTHHQGGFRPIQFFQQTQMQTARPALPGNNPSLRPGSQAPAPAAVYQSNQAIMMTMAPMPFPSPQAAQYYIPQYRHSTPYVGPPQQYSVQPPGPGTFYPSPGPGEFPTPYAGPPYYTGQTVYPPSPPIIVPTPQQPLPTKREKKTIRIRDPNQGGKDITEEIMSGGSGSRNPTPPAVRPSSTPTPPQFLCPHPHYPHIFYLKSQQPSSQILDHGHMVYSVETPPQLPSAPADSKPTQDDKPKPESPLLKCASPGLRQLDSPVEKRDTSGSVLTHTPYVKAELPLTMAAGELPETIPSKVDKAKLATPPPSRPESTGPEVPPISQTPPPKAVNGLSDREVTVSTPGRDLSSLFDGASQQPSSPQATAPPSAPVQMPCTNTNTQEPSSRETVDKSPLLSPSGLALDVQPLLAAPAVSTVAAIPAALPSPLPPAEASGETEEVRRTSIGADTQEDPHESVEEAVAGSEDKVEAPQQASFKKVPGTVAQPVPVAPKSWKKPKEISLSGEVSRKEREDAPMGEASSDDASSSPTERGSPLPPLVPDEPPSPEENGDAGLEAEPVGNGAVHSSETESSDSGGTHPGKREITPEPTELGGKRQYDRDFLLSFQFMPACMQKPEGLPPISDVVLDKINQNKLPMRTMDSRVISRGPDFTPAFADFGRQLSGGRGAPAINMSARRPQPRKIIMNVSVNDDVQLKKAENAWKPGMKREGIADDPDAQKTKELFRKVRSILNKLTPQMFNQLMKQVTDLTIDTEERLKGVIDLVFEKAIDEPSFSVAYSHMCRCLATLKVPMADKPSTTVNFRKLLLNRCQKEFERDKVDDVVFEKKQKELEAATSASERERLQEELEEAKDKARRRSIGNIKFIGELFKLKMLTEAIMHDCVVKLLKNHDEESLECLCRLLTTIGKDLDFEKAKPRMDQYFNQMEKIVKERKTSSRIRFMLQDVIDLRLHNWVSRRVDQGPKTIEQIHKEARIEEQEEQRKVHQQLLSKENKRRPGNGKCLNYVWEAVPFVAPLLTVCPDLELRSEQREQRALRDETWSTVPMTKNSRTIDPNKIPKISKPTIDDKIQLGPRAQVNWMKGSSGGAKTSDSDQARPSGTSINRYYALQSSTTPSSTPSPAPASLGHELDSRRVISSRSSTSRERNDKPLSPAPTRPTPFSRSSTVKDLPESPGPEDARREVSEAPCQPTTPTAEDKAEPERSRGKESVKPDAPVAPPSEKPLLSEEEMERKCKSIIDEFLHITDYKEAVQCVEDLDQEAQLHVFVRMGVESTLERSQITRDHMGLLLFQLVQTGTLPKAQFFKGFVDMLELADDMAIDIPHIWLYLAELLSPMLRDGGISMRELFSELSKPLLPVGRAGILFSEILHLLCKQMSHRKVGALWKESGFSWRDFLPEGEDVHTFISDQKLEFTMSDCLSPSTQLSGRALSPQELNTQLEKLLMEDAASDEQIFDWVEAHLDECEMSSPPFLRALMTAVCKAAVKGEGTSCRVDTAIIQRRLPVLLKYLNSDTERQLQALYALQALIVTLDQPPNLLRMFFDCLYDEDVISEDAFYKWEASKDPAEQLGKGVALKSVTAFFTWLREAEEESEDN